MCSCERTDTEAIYLELLTEIRHNIELRVIVDVVSGWRLIAQAEGVPVPRELYQEYLPGPEYGMALLGNPGTGFTSFPPLEVDFSALPDGLDPILSFESKTMPDSPYWTDIRFRPAELSDRTIAALRRGAERLFERIQCRDYARFDYRVGADGEIKLMEVNPNPAWDPEAKLAIMAGFARKTYPQMLALLLDAAQIRVAAASHID